LEYLRNNDLGSQRKTDQRRHHDLGHIAKITEGPTMSSDAIRPTVAQMTWRVKNTFGMSVYSKERTEYTFPILLNLGYLLDNVGFVTSMPTLNAAIRHIRFSGSDKFFHKPLQF
jgi:hypothetical protein